MRYYLTGLAVFLSLIVTREAVVNFLAWRQEVRNADPDVVMLGILGVYRPAGYALLALLLILLSLWVFRTRSWHHDEQTERH